MQTSTSSQEDGAASGDRSSTAGAAADTGPSLNSRSCQRPQLVPAAGGGLAIAGRSRYSSDESRPLSSVRRLSRSSTDAGTALPALDGKPGAVSHYVRYDVARLELRADGGIVADQRLAPSHISRERDVLFIDEQTLSAARGRGGAASGPLTVGQNVTTDGSSAPVGEWCVGDLVQVGGALVRIRSCRKPCPKNNHVHGEGAHERMLARALGGVFGTVASWVPGEGLAPAMPAPGISSLCSAAAWQSHARF